MLCGPWGAGAADAADDGPDEIGCGGGSIAANAEGVAGTDVSGTGTVESVDAGGAGGAGGAAAAAAGGGGAAMAPKLNDPAGHRQLQLQAFAPIAPATACGRLGMTPFAPFAGLAGFAGFAEAPAGLTVTTDAGTTGPRATAFPPWFAAAPVATD
jgi:hypothetical protein